LIGDDLNFGNRFYRRLKAKTGGAVVVVVETVNRNIIRVSRAAGKRESSALRLLILCTFGYS
jgi:hypothetical protein